MSGSDRGDPTETRLIGGEEMFTVYRIEHSGSDPSLQDQLMPFRSSAAIRLLWLEQELVDRDWPPLNQRVLVGEDGDAWAELPADWAEGIAAQDASGQLEVPWHREIDKPDVPRIERGLNFIKRRAKP